MKLILLVASLSLLAACAQTPPADNVASANVTDADVTEVADDSAGANAVDNVSEAPPGKTVSE